MPVTLNNEQKLYVIPGGDGYSCFGFASCFDEVEQLAQALGEPPPVEADYGTLALYERHGQLVQKYRLAPASRSTWFNKHTPPDLKDLLHRLIHSRAKVRIFYGQTDPNHEKFGRSWLDEYDMVGTIGRSTGTLKVPLLIPARADGGSALLDSCIIRVVDCATGRDLYRMAGYREHQFDIRPSSQDGYVEDVDVDGVLHARFPKSGAAARWVAFMKGERFTK